MKLRRVAGGTWRVPGERLTWDFRVVGETSKVAGGTWRVVGELCVISGL